MMAVNVPVLPLVNLLFFRTNIFEEMSAKVFLEFMKYNRMSGDLKEEKTTVFQDFRALLILRATTAQFFVHTIIIITKIIIITIIILKGGKN